MSKPKTILVRITAEEYAAVLERRAWVVREKHRLSSAVDRASKPAGECGNTGCRRPAEPGKSKCKLHLQQLREAQAARRARLRAEEKPAWICRELTCSREVVPGKAQCPEHVAAASERAKRRFARRKEAGVCVQCSRPVVPGMTRCEVHRARKARPR